MLLGVDFRGGHVQEYVVTALQMFSLDAVNATEFLEVYKGVVPPGEFSGMLDELTSGTIMCLHGAASCAVHMLSTLVLCFYTQERGQTKSHTQSLV